MFPVPHPGHGWQEGTAIERKRPLRPTAHTANPMLHVAQQMAGGRIPLGSMPGPRKKPLFKY